MQKNVQSPFVEELEESARIRHEQHARETFNLYYQMRFASQRNHVEYGKWLIASMLAIHGGSIYAISSLRSSMNILPPGAWGGLMSGVGWNLFGIGFIMAAGFMAWVNFQYAEHQYAGWANPAIVYRTDMWPKASKHDALNATMFMAAIFGLSSFFCFVAGAIEVYGALTRAV